MGGTDRLGGHRIALGATVVVVFALSIGALAGRLSEAQAGTPPVAPDVTLATPPEPREPAQPAARAEAPRPAPARPERARPSTCGDAGRIVRWRVAVGSGVDADADRVRRVIAAVLCDERGWTRGGRVRFRYDPDASLVIGLRTAAATERRCMRLIGLSVRGKWSCASRGAREVVLNADRWFGGSPSWPGSVSRYRVMLVNHEVGHILGHGHRACRGGKAPVMMQQSKGLAGCRANPWPLAAEIRATR